MSKNRNLKYQFMNAIQKNFKERMNKHSLKKEGAKKGSEIFSYAQRKNLIDLSSNFSNWMKINHGEIKYVRDIKQEHVQEFLNSKRELCSQATLDNYKAQFCKLECIVNRTYHVNVNYHTSIIYSNKNNGGKIRSNMCTQKQYEKLLQTTNENLKIGLKMSKVFGLRASEITKFNCSKDIKLDGIQIVDSKGKRSRFIECETQEQKQLLQELQQKQGRLCPIHTQSLEQAFNRECKKQGVIINSGNGAFHSLRKLFATQEYKRNREEGLEIQESLNKVSKRLGHNENRNKLMKTYICCAIE